MKIVNRLCSDTMDKYAGDNVIILASDGVMIQIPCSLMCPSDFELNNCLIDNEDCIGLGKCKECFNVAIKDITGVQIFLSNKFTGVKVANIIGTPIIDLKETSINE